MFDYWTRGGKIALICFVLIGVIGLPTAYYMGSTLNSRAYDMLNNQYLQLQQQYDELSGLFDLLLLENIDLESELLREINNNIILNNVILALQVNITILEAVIAEMEQKLDLYIGLIRNMPFHERLIIWSNAVRVYTYKQMVSTNLHAALFLLNMTKHNSNIVNNYNHIDILLSDILQFENDNSMFEMHRYLSSHVDYYDSETHNVSDIYEILNTETDNELDTTTGLWNYTYYMKSAIETYFERVGDDIDLTILLASCLVSSDKTVYIALDVNSTLYDRGRRAFLFAHDASNPCANWTLGGVDGWVLLDLADEHAYDEYPLWLANSYIAANNTEWVDNEIEYRYRIEVE